MFELNVDLLDAPEFSDHLHSSPINGTNARGLYNPMQFILRLRSDIHKELEDSVNGIDTIGLNSWTKIQAFSTYMHETIHWWQHVGSNFGFISSLKYPAQAHIVHSDLKTILNEEGAFKSILKFDKQHPTSNININKILNYWHDIEFAGQIAFDPKNKLPGITKNPYFECWGHSYSLMWSSAIWTMAATIDRSFFFLPNIKAWDYEFTKLRENKTESFYYGSSNIIPPIGTKAIFEGQARFSQIQYLHAASGGNVNLNDFAKIGMLNGIYFEAFNLFLETLKEKPPLNADHSIIGLFLLVCDIAMNPTDGFPFDITHYESFIITNDPGYRFCLLCQMIRDKHPYLKESIVNYSKQEYIEISKILAYSISCLSPYESSAFVNFWTVDQKEIRELLFEETIYKYSPINLPIRLFFSKYLRFQQDKFKYPELFCWPGIHFVERNSNTVALPEAYELFEKHKALFIDDAKGDIYHSANKCYTEEQMDETLNDFFAWNATYDMVRKWIVEEGPFKFDYQWLTSKYTDEQMKIWACNHFKTLFNVDPEKFTIL